MNFLIRENRAAIGLNGPKNVTAILLKWSVAFLSLVCVAGCTEFEYQYLSLTEDMEIVEYGYSEVGGLSGHAKMPISYSIERDQYSINAFVDLEATQPKVIFEVDGKMMLDAKLRGEVASSCIGRITPIVDGRRVYAAETAQGLEFMLASYAPDHECRRLLADPDYDVELVLTITNGAGTTVGTETVRMNVITNGTVRAFDAL